VTIVCCNTRITAKLIKTRFIYIRNYISPRVKYYKIIRVYII